MRITLIILALTLCTVQGFAQAQKVGCDDKAIRFQGEQVKNAFKEQGMKVTRDAMVSMESRVPFPIAVQLEQGKIYQFIYIGDRRASKIDFELYDADDKKLDVRTLKKPIENNSLIYSFIPEKSDIYLIILSQKWKTKSMCGSFTIMEQTANK